MPSNVYFFDPSTASSVSSDKPLLQVMREAEVARPPESVQIIRNVFKRIAGLFQAKKPAAKVSGVSVKTAPADERRLAA